MESENEENNNKIIKTEELIPLFIKNFTKRPDKFKHVSSFDKNEIKITPYKSEISKRWMHKITLPYKTTRNENVMTAYQVTGELSSYHNKTT